jgi:uncharacterized spore protein YtfJ
MDCFGFGAGGSQIKTNPKDPGSGSILGVVVVLGFFQIG